MSSTAYYSLTELFTNFCLELAELYALDRAGVAELDTVSNRFQIHCQWDALTGQAELSDRTFSRDQTVGDWVLKNGQAFVGNTERAVWSFEQTFRDFERDAFQSNYVNVFDYQNNRLVFLLSKKAHAFADDSELPGLLTRLQHLMDFALRCAQQGSWQQSARDLLREYYRSSNDVPSIEQWEASYIDAVLEITNGRIDGEKGAARLARLKPSTFRFRKGKHVES